MIIIFREFNDFAKIILFHKSFSEDQAVGGGTVCIERKAESLHIFGGWQCADRQQPCGECDPTVCGRTEELAVQQYSKRGEMQCGVVFDCCHCSGKRAGCGTIFDGVVLEAGWDGYDAF